MHHQRDNSASLFQQWKCIWQPITHTFPLKDKHAHIKEGSLGYSPRGSHYCTATQLTTITVDLKQQYDFGL